MADDLAWMGLEAPRYTSYPTAHHFTPQVGAAVQAGWMQALPPGATVSVYVHIPFCHELCWFCGCHTKMTKRYEPIAAYVQVLLQELALVRAQLPAGVRLQHIHFGGGPPSLLSGEDMTAILEAIARGFTFDIPCELAIELDPRTTTSENIRLYGALGVNRVSLGIQDFDPTVQAAINRVQSFELLQGMVQQLRDAGIHHINTDLIYGLPHQTTDRFARTLDQTLALAPDRLALFSYAHLPELKKHQRLIHEADLPSPVEKLALFQSASRQLAAAGYEMVGFDHFTKPQDAMAVAARNRTLKRNFQGYVSEDCDAIIGIGCSSISQYPQGYVQNSAQAHVYREAVTSGALAGVRGVAFAGEDLARKAVIDALMCYMEADVAAIAAQHGLPGHAFRAELERLCSAEYNGVVACDGTMVRLVTPHRMAIRVVAAVFDAYAARPTHRYSKVA